MLRPFKEGPLYKASRKFEGPFRIIQILSLNKCVLKHISTGKIKTQHCNNLKLIDFDVDYTFAKDTINEDVSSQVQDEIPMPSQQEDESSAQSHRYNLRNRARL